MRRCELAKAVGADQHGISRVDDARVDNARYDGTDEGDGEGVIDMKFEGSVGVIVAVVGKNVKEGSDEVEGFACDVGDLEDRTDALRDELRGRLNSVGAVFDENGNLARSG